MSGNLIGVATTFSLYTTVYYVTVKVTQMDDWTSPQQELLQIMNVPTSTCEFQLYLNYFYLVSFKVVHFIIVFESFSCCNLHGNVQQPD